jgi:hypothetical protein
MLYRRWISHRVVELMAALAVVGLYALSHRVREMSATVLKVAATYVTTTRG